MTTMILMRGFPSSGKSTWAKAWVDEDSLNRVRINRDDLRTQFYGKKVGLDFKQEEFISFAERALVEQSIKEGKDVVVDSMHLRPKYLRDWFKFASRRNLTEVVIHEILIPDLNELLSRNSKRIEGDRIDERALQGMWTRFTKKEQLLPVETYEDFLEKETNPLSSVQKYVPLKGKPRVLLVDVDGTVALNSSGRGWFDWSRVGEDTPNEGVVSLVRTLQSSPARDFQIIFLSGRSDICMEETLHWLEEAGIYPSQLFMREDTDNRPDTETKLEIFNKVIRDHYDVVAVIDDRPSVNRMWRSLGLTTLQVGDPHVEF